MKTERLGLHARLIRGITFKPADKVTPGERNSLVCLRTKNVQSTLDQSDLIAVPKNFVKSADKLIRIGDTLVSSANSWNLVGKCCSVEELLYPSTAGGFISILRPVSDSLDPAYLYRWFSSEHIQRTVRSFSNQTTNISNLDHRRVLQLPIPLPPLPEQKRIAAILDAADALRAKRRESLVQLDTLLQSTFIEMFGDPVMNPMGFPVRALSEFYINKRDGTKCGPFGSALKKNELVQSGVPVWNMDNIAPSGRMVLPFRMWVTEDKYRQLEAYAVVDGDVIISRAGTVGKMCVADTGCKLSIISTNLIRVRFGPSLLPIYFVSLMNYCKGRVGRLKTGPDGAFTHMSTGVLDKLKFPYPPLDLQHRFATIVELVEQQKTRMRAHLDELDALFASLQSRAFSGEL